MHRPGPPRGGMIPEMPGIFPRGERERSEAFKQLTEDERQRVRSAFEKVWKNPDVVQARERLMKANEEYRETLHRALEGADPGVTAILDKLKKSKPEGNPPLAGRMPEANDPEFARKVLMRLKEDLHKWAKSDKREISPERLRERVLDAPAVRELVKQLEDATEPQQRVEIAGKLREACMARWQAEFGPLREGPGPGKPERREKLAAPDEVKD